MMMNRSRIVLLALGLAWAGLQGSEAAAQQQFSGDVVKIGILNDQSGIYADLGGPGSVEAARMAIEEFGGKVLGKKIELISGDHQNKADVGSAVARTWYENEGVDMIADFANSAVALAVQALANDKRRIALITAASSELTGKACTPTSAQWVYNSYTNGYGLAKTMTEKGYDTWYLLTVDYAFGHAFAADITRAVKDAGGKMLGETRHPLNIGDMSSFLLQAQSSKAKTIALASAGRDMTTTIKQAAEFGITGKQTLVAPIVFLNDIHALGLQDSQGLQFMTAFYWDRDGASRAWSKKFFERRKVMPTMVHSGVYSMVRHYLRAVEAAQTDDAMRVMAKMRELPVQDAVTSNGWLREDGQMIHDMFLAEVKKPSESKEPWDYYKIVATVPGKTIFKPLSESDCPLVKHKS